MNLHTYKLFSKYSLELAQTVNTRILFSFVKVQCELNVRQKRVYTDLQRARLSRCRMLWLLAYPIPSIPSVSSTGNTRKTEKERQLAQRWARSRITRLEEALSSINNPILSVRQSPTTLFKVNKMLILGDPLASFWPILHLFRSRDPI